MQPINRIVFRNITALRCLSILVGMMSATFMSGVAAQFASVADTIVCFEYNLPAAQGAGLSDQVVYSSEPVGSGVVFTVGEAITTSTSVFLYDIVNGYEEWYSVFVVERVPRLYGNSDLQGCNAVILPAASGDNITAAFYYGLTQDGLGPRYYPGQQIDTSVTLYLFDGQPGCATTDSVSISISREPIINIRDSIATCGYYVLPEPDVALADSAQYFLPGGAEAQVGDTLYASTDLVLAVSSGACSVDVPINVVFQDLRVVEQIPDQQFCGNATVAVDDYFEAFNPRIQISGNGLVTSADSRLTIRGQGNYTICLSDVLGVCSEEVCFEAEVLELDTFIGSSFRGDTLQTCRVSNVFLSEIPQFAGFFSTLNEPDQLYLDGVEILNGVVGGFFLDRPHHRVDYIKFSDARCREPDTLTFILEMTEDCDFRDNIISASCLDIVTYSDLLAALPIFGATFYTLDGRLVNDRNFREATDGDTTPILAVYPIQGSTTFDTVELTIINTSTITVLEPQVSDIELCAMEEVEILYGPEGYPVFVWDSELFLLVGNDTISVGSEGVGGESTITYDPGAINDGVRAGRLELSRPNSTYMLVITAGNAWILDSISLRRQSCLTNNSDTLIIRTLDNTIRLIEDQACTGDTVSIGGIGYTAASPADTILMPGAARNGCDSLTYVDINFVPEARHFINTLFCDTSLYVVVDCKRYDHRTPSDVIVLDQASVSGCDSIIVIDLQYQIPIILRDSTSLCDGQAIMIDGIAYRAGEVIRDTISAMLGCDSIIVETYLEQLPVLMLAVDTTLCLGDTLYVGGDTITDDVSYEISELDVNGCDSVLWDVTVVYEAVDMPSFDDYVICPGSSSTLYFTPSPVDYFVAGQPIVGDSLVVTESSVVQIVGVSPLGCIDSMEFDVVVVQVDTDVLPDTLLIDPADSEVPVPVDYTTTPGLVQWSPAEAVTCIDCRDPQIAEGFTGLIYLEAVDDSGCTYRDTMYVKRSTLERWYFPNVFSPDGINSGNRALYLQSYPESLSYDMMIYDRWGSLVYAGQNLKSNNQQQGWDGAQYTSGIYVAIITIYTVGASEVVIQDVLLLR